jgi:hypothetical protein
LALAAMRLRFAISLPLLDGDEDFHLLLSIMLAKK